MPKKSDTDAELARQYGSDPRTVRRWRKENAPLHDGKKMAEWIAARHCGPKGAEPASLAEAKLKKVLLECEKLAFRNDVERKRYTANDEIQRDHIRIAAGVRASLQALRGEAPTWAGLSPAEMAKRLDGRLDAITATLHDSLSALYK